MTTSFSVRCKACGGGWIMLDVSTEDLPDHVAVFPRIMCLGCGISEDVRSNIKRTESRLGGVG